jgi:hypothetical protein
MATTLPTISRLRSAVETRDATSLKSFYASDAVLTIIDNDNPPSRPRRLNGKREIDAFLDDLYGRDMTHRLEFGVADGMALAFVQSCHYGDGTQAVAATAAELSPAGIVRQTTVQAWDN